MNTNRSDSLSKTSIALMVVLLALVLSAHAGKLSIQDGKPRYAAAITCMDGAYQDPVKANLCQRCKVDCVDMITEAGPVGILTSEPANDFENAVLENIKKRVAISVRHHHVKVVAIVAHEDCAGNPGPKEKKEDKDRQGKQLRQAREKLIVYLAAMGRRDVEVVLLWVEGPWKKPRVTEIK